MNRSGHVKIARKAQSLLALLESRQGWHKETQAILRDSPFWLEEREFSRHEALGFLRTWIVGEVACRDLAATWGWTARRTASFVDLLAQYGIATLADGAYVLEGASGPISVSMRGARRKDGEVPLGLRNAIFARDGGLCTKCGVAVYRGADYVAHPQQAQVDHVNPVSNGGSTETTNLRLLCQACNARKGARGAEFYAEAP